MVSIQASVVNRPLNLLFIIKMVYFECYLRVFPSPRLPNLCIIRGTCHLALNLSSVYFMCRNSYFLQIFCVCNVDYMKLCILCPVTARIIFRSLLNFISSESKRENSHFLSAWIFVHFIHICQSLDVTECRKCVCNMFWRLFA